MARNSQRQTEPDLFGHGQAEAPAADERWPPDDQPPGTLSEARRMAVTCTRCDLYRNATQTVFGEGTATRRHHAGRRTARRPGRPAGPPLRRPRRQVLDRALADAGIDRSTLYVTNGVKHFKSRAARQEAAPQNAPISREIDVCRLVARHRAHARSNRRWSWRLERDRRARGITGRSASIASLRGGKPNRPRTARSLSSPSIRPIFSACRTGRPRSSNIEHFVADLEMAAEAAPA